MKFALTGGMGAGKSTALKIFQTLGVPVFSADAFCAHYYTTHFDELQTLAVARWGSDILDFEGKLDRKKISDLIFKSPTERAWWEGLFHPGLKLAIEKFQLENPNSMVEVPLLFEAGWDTMFDVVISLWAPLASIQKRIVERGLSSDEVQMRMVSQLPMDEKLKRAHIGLINTGDIFQLEAQCKVVLSQFNVLD